MIHHSEQSTQQCAHIWSDNNPTSLHKEVEGYMGSDDLQLARIQLPTSRTGQTGQRGQTGQTEFESKARYNTHFRRWCTERPSK